MQPGSLTSEELVAHAEGLRRLARSLTRDEASADDLVQDTLIAAWQSSGGPRHGLGAWLRGITRNLARKRYRETDRRRRRELRAARNEALPATAEAAAGIEMRRRLLALMDELPVGQRTALFLRYFEDLPPRRIAQRMDCPVATVHTNLRRGRERLRRALDDSVGGERNRWAIALLPARQGGGFVSALIGGLAMKKVIAFALALAFLALGTWFVRDNWFGEGPRVSEAARLLTATEAAGPVLSPGGEKPQAKPVEADSVAPETTEPRHLLALLLEPDGPLMPGVVRVVTKPIRDMRPGERWDGKDFDVVSHGEGSPHVADITALFAEHQQPMIEFEIELDHPAYLPVRHRLKLGMAEHEAAENVFRYRAVIRLRRAAVIAGRVVSPEGMARGGAFVGAWPRDYGRPVALVQTDEQGAYRLRTPGGRDFAIVAMQRGLHPSRAYVRVDPAAETTCDDLVLAAGSSLRGSLLLNEQPLKGAGVSLRRAEEGEPWQNRYTAWHATSSVEIESWHGPMKDSTAGELVVQEHARGLALGQAAAATDAEGRFALEGLTPGTHRVRVAPWIRAGFLHRALSKALERSIEVPHPELTLRIEASIVRFLVTSDGEPLQGASVRVGIWHGNTELSETQLAALSKEVSAEDLASLSEDSCHLKTKEDGRTALPLLVPPGAELRVVVSCDGFASQVRTLRSKPAGESWQEAFALEGNQPSPSDPTPTEADQQPEATRGTLVLQLKTPDGILIPRCAIGLYKPGGKGPSPWSRRRARSDDNTYRVENITPGSYRVVARPGGTWAGTEDFWLDAEAQVEIRAVKEARIALSTRRGGRVRLWVRDASGRPCTSRCRVKNADGETLQVGFVSRQSGGHGLGSSGLSSPGPNEVVRALPPGRYVLEFCSHKVRDRDATQVRKEVLLKAGELVDLRIELPDP